MRSFISAPWLCLMLGSLVAGCVKQDPLIMQRSVIEVGSGAKHRHATATEVWIEIPLQHALRGDHEVGIICDDETWQVVWAARETFRMVDGWGSGVLAKQPPYYAAPGLGTRGLDCDNVPNCHFLGILAELRCPGEEPKPAENPHFALELPLAVSKRRYEIVVLRSRAQRGLPVWEWANAPAALGSGPPMKRVPQ